jgi:hypothetical protein
MVGRKRSDGRPPGSAKGVSGSEHSGFTGHIRNGPHDTSANGLSSSDRTSGASVNRSAVGVNVPTRVSPREEQGASVSTLSGDTSSEVFLVSRRASNACAPELALGALQYANKAKGSTAVALCKSDRGSTPLDQDGSSIPKFEGTYLKVALLVQLLAESVHSCMLEQAPMVRSPA